MSLFSPSKNSAHIKKQKPPFKVQNPGRAVPNRSLQAEFIISSGKPETFPSDRLPEIAFLGRSNVGKSSLINSLTGSKKLAFTSSTPGRTQTINFYRIDGAFYFVDLPGYGYARAPLARVQEWGALIENYLENRDTLVLSCLTIDSRRGWMEYDLNLKRWLEQHGRPYIVVVTKTDKLSKSDQERGLRSIRQEGAAPLPFSALTGRGVREIWQAITTTLQQR